MFYISGCENKNGVWFYKVTDTSDNVTESYTNDSLMEYLNKGIKIFGLNKSYKFECQCISNFLIVPDDRRNKLYIYSITNEKLVDSFDFGESAYCNRNAVWLNCGATQVKLSKDKRKILIRSEVTVKYDYEFTGLYFLGLDVKTGYIMSKVDEVMFVCDNSKEVHSIIEKTQGDCPNFLTSYGASNILREKGLV